MSKIAYYLQEHLSGEVIESSFIRDAFSEDASALSIRPLVVTYPADERDIRKIARFCWQLSERGRYLPITARGGGSDLNGAAIGEGLIISLPAHLNQIKKFDMKNGIVVVDPGINFAKLQQTLYTHGYFLPFEPSSSEYSTIGGAVANNSGGKQSLKYGNSLNYVKSLRVVLSNGEIIETGPLNNKELSKKMGQLNFEGEIYRALDALLEEHKDLSDLAKNISRKASGYNIDMVKTKFGFDLTPLFIGSQGTLGIITEITLKCEELKLEQEKYLIAYLENNQDIQSAIVALRSMSEPPEVIEYLDQNTIKLAEKISSNVTSGWLQKPYPKGILVLGFLNQDKSIRKSIAKAEKILRNLSSVIKTIEDNDEINIAHKLATINALILNHVENQSYAIPLLTDVAVPIDNIEKMLSGLDSMIEKSHIDNAVWGRLGEGILRIQPILDITQVGDRQALFKYLNEGADLAVSLGGSITAENGEGRLKTPFMSKEFSEERLSLFKEVKKIFDPLNILNPGVKHQTSEDDIKAILKKSTGSKSNIHQLPRY